MTEVVIHSHDLRFTSLFNQVCLRYPHYLYYIQTLCAKCTRIYMVLYLLMKRIIDDRITKCRLGVIFMNQGEMNYRVISLLDCIPSIINLRLEGTSRSSKGSNKQYSLHHFINQIQFSKEGRNACDRSDVNRTERTENCYSTNIMKHSG